MRIDELTTLNDVLKSDQYVTLLKHLKTKVGDNINVTRIKNQVMKSWSKGKKSHKHYSDLLGTIGISLNDIIKK